MSTDNPQHPPMVTLTPNLMATPWVDLADKLTEQHSMTRIGVLPGGMTSGMPTVHIAAENAAGEVVVVETSYRLFAAAYRALAAHWEGHPGAG